MPEYEFTFVVDGTDLDDDAVQVLTDDLDALFSRFHGVLRMSVAAEGPNAVAAAAEVFAHVRMHAGRVRLVRLDRDLVGVADIAERTGRTRQNVTQWIRGERRNSEGAAFPRPEGAVGRSLVWLWSEVNEWLRGIGLDDGENHPTRSEMTDIDYRLQQWNPNNFPYRRSFPSSGTRSDSERHPWIRYVGLEETPSP
ncbi:hypothetical protein [Nocardiopsis rhodophaea]|uniref:helix-turn-helix transcriptional regulator n=1 Tax=Nocardiopsis rhodophaea TaxID=280238 RepID=UPI0031D79D6E